MMWGGGGWGSKLNAKSAMFKRRRDDARLSCSSVMKSRRPPDPRKEAVVTSTGSFLSVAGLFIIELLKRLIRKDRRDFLGVKSDCFDVFSSSSFFKGPVQQ